MPEEAATEFAQSQQKKKPRRRKRKGKQSSENIARTDNLNFDLNATAQAQVISGVIKQVNSKVTKQVTSGVTKQVNNGVSKQVNSGVSKQVNSGVSKQVNSGVSKQVNSGVSKQVNNGVSKQVNSGVSKQVNSGVSKQVSSGISKQVKSAPSRSKNKRRNRADRYYGRFCCKVCRRRWDSALVFTRAGTKKVLFKQRCQNCDHRDAWVFPYRLELLRCSQCQSHVCECLCEECGKLKHRRYQDDQKQTVDDSFEYCLCDKRSKVPLGVHIKIQKPHLSNLCQKCLSGFPCRATLAELDKFPDNEL